MRKVWLLSLALGLSHPARAQELPAAPPPPTPEQRLSEIQADASLDPALKRALTDLYGEAIARARDAAASRERTARVKREEQDAGAEVRAIDEELARPPADEPLSPTEPATLPDIERALAQAQADRDTASASLAAIKEQIRTISERAAALPTLIARQRELVNRPAPAPVPDDPPAVAEARAAAAAGTLDAQRAELEALESELATSEIRTTLLQRRSDQALRRLNQREKLLAAWQELATARRQLEAERAAAEARRAQEEAAREHPYVQEIAAASAKLAELRTGPLGVVRRQSEADVALARASERIKALKEDFERTRRRVKLLGVPKSLGQALRRERERLVDPEVLRARISDNKAEASTVGLLLIDLEDGRTATADPDLAVLQRLGDSPDPGVRAAARDLLIAQRKLIDDLIREHRQLSATLLTLIQTHREQLELNRAYRRYIDERILWVRSSIAIGPRDLQAMPAALATLARDPNWRDIARGPGLYPSLLLAGAAIALVLRTRIARDLDRLARNVASIHTDSSGHTLRALGTSCLLALPLPALVFAAALMVEPREAALRFALERIAAYWAFAGLFLSILRPRGLAEAHFRWDAPVCAAFRRAVLTLLLFALPLVFIAAYFDRAEDDAGRDSLGRLALTAGLAVVAWTAGRVFRASSPVRRSLATTAKGSVLSRLRIVWHPTLILTPLALAAIALVGYSFTALVLARRFQISLGIVVLLFILSAIIQRTFFVARRRLALKAAIERRAAKTGEAGEHTPQDIPDIARIGTQTQALLRTFTGGLLILGLFLTWADVLPALGRLDNVRIWPSISIVDPAADLPEPAPTEAAPAQPPHAGSPVPVPTLSTPPDAAPTAPARVITLADLILALAILLATVIAGTNIPGLLELTILPRLPLDAGIRYAIHTISRYTITILGLILGFSTLGIGWSSVQWLAAALTFGLAFGLQEIFANFVSGIIMLFERPVRVGDIITVRDTSGTVSRIRMRAVTITTFDRRELIVPNREFITGPILNWTLSDATTRIIIPIGVGYQSDPRHVRDILLACAAGHRDVLKEPAPVATLASFGDNALNFELRCFVPAVDAMLRIRDELSFEVHAALAKAGVPIPYPQRDIHIHAPAGGIPVALTPPPRE